MAFAPWELALSWFGYDPTVARCVPCCGLLGCSCHGHPGLEDIAAADHGAGDAWRGKIAPTVPCPPCSNAVSRRPAIQPNPPSPFVHAEIVGSPGGCCRAGQWLIFQGEGCFGRPWFRVVLQPGQPPSVVPPPAVAISQRSRRSHHPVAVVVHGDMPGS